MVGTYEGSVVFTNGATTTETLTITRQKNGIFFGTTSQTNGANGIVKGSITRAGKVHFIDHGTLVKFVSTGNGVFANNTLTITVHAAQGGTNLKGVMTLNKVA